MTEPWQGFASAQVHRVEAECKRAVAVRGECVRCVALRERSEVEFLVIRPAAALGVVLGLHIGAGRASGGARGRCRRCRRRRRLLELAVERARHRGDGLAPGIDTDALGRFQAARRRHVTLARNSREGQRDGQLVKLSKHSHAQCLMNPWKKHALRVHLRLWARARSGR